MTKSFLATALLLTMLAVPTSAQTIRVTYGDGVCRATSCMGTQPVPAPVMEPRALRTKTASSESDASWIYWILIWFF